MNVLLRHDLDPELLEFHPGDALEADILKGFAAGAPDLYAYMAQADNRTRPHLVVAKEPEPTNPPQQGEPT